MKTLLLIFLPLLSLPLMAQEVSNVQVRQEAGELVVSFDLSGNDDEYQVRVEGSEDHVHFNVLKTITMKSGKQELRFPFVVPVFVSSAVFRVSAKDYLNAIFDGMFLMKGDTFQMGSNHPDADSDEKPKHLVQLADYYIGMHEVTQKQWQNVMNNNPSRNKNCPECPVENVSWFDVQLFLQKLNSITGRSYRLPTEAEWEFAAQQRFAGDFLTDEYIEAFGDIWYSDNSGGRTHPIGEDRGRPDEMIGNVWEWCSDWYEEGYYRSRPDPDINPQGPLEGRYKAARGGSWNDPLKICRAQNRGTSSPGDRYNRLGFRLAHPAP